MNHLEFLRRERGISQRELAAIIGVNQSILSRCERGWWTKPPKGLEGKLQAYFGKQWTFDKLMQPVSDATPAIIPD